MLNMVGDHNNCSPRTRSGYFLSFAPYNKIDHITLILLQISSRKPRRGGLRCGWQRDDKFASKLLLF